MRAAVGQLETCCRELVAKSPRANDQGARPDEVLLRGEVSGVAGMPIADGRSAWATPLCSGSLGAEECRGTSATAKRRQVLLKADVKPLTPGRPLACAAA